MSGTSDEYGELAIAKSELMAAKDQSASKQLQRAVENNQDRLLSRVYALAIFIALVVALVAGGKTGIIILSAVGAFVGLLAVLRIVQARRLRRLRQSQLEALRRMKMMAHENQSGSD